MVKIPECLEQFKIENLKKLEIKRGIYFLIKQNSVIYIGKSENVHARVPTHRGKFYDEVFYFESNGDIDSLEADFIKILKPKLNIQKGKRKRKIYL